AVGADPVHAANLRRRIIALGVIVLAIFVASSGYDAWRSPPQIVNDTHRGLDSLAKALAEHAEGSLQTIDLLLRETKAWYAVERSGAESQLNATLARRAAGLPHVRQVAITDAQGKVLFHSRDIPPAIGDVADRRYFT